MAKRISKQIAPSSRSRVSAMSLGPPVSQRFSPFKELGTAGVAVFGGRPVVHEKDYRVQGRQRWITYADIATNTSIIAAGVRYFLNIVEHAKWTLTPADDSSEAKAVAEFIDSVVNDMNTPWRRVMRRSAMYRFQGFGVQEWTAKRRDVDSKIGLDDIEARPQHTIDRWEVDERGSVLGAWQISPQTNKFIYLPRQKILYLVEDSLTDSPEGLGLFRHLVEPFERLRKYLTLEGWGFERDLRGIPIGRLPYQALRASVKAGAITQKEADALIRAVESFVKIQTKQEDTSIVLDSAPYVVDTDSGKQISGVMQYGLELLQGQSPDFGASAAAITRLNLEMARIIGVEHLLLGGDQASANRALSEDKSRNFYLTVNGTLDEIEDGVQRDIVGTICDLNGIKNEMKPQLLHSDIAYRAVQEVTGALRDMATAGAVLSPTDPAIDDVRDMLGISKSEPPPPEMMGALPPAKGNGKMPDQTQTKSPGETQPANSETGANNGGGAPNQA